MKCKTLHIISFLFYLFFSNSFYTLFAQEEDIDAYLIEIEKGNKKIVVDKLPELKKKFAGNPSIVYLEGLLIEDGQKAVKIFDSLLEKFPESKYADASLYRIYSFHHSLGLYETAQKNLDKMKKQYPGSSFLKLIEGKTLAEEIPEQKPETRFEKQKKTEGLFTIQAGAFGNPSNALRLKKDFENAGYFSEIREKTVGGTNFNVVYVGRFATYNEAENFLYIINSNFNLSGKIAERNW